MQSEKADGLLRMMSAAHRYCEMARTITLPRFRTQIAVVDKGPQGDAGASANFDPVTKADREAEKAIRDAVLADFPEHGFHGEEFGEVNSDAPTRWIVDPIDGTRAFITGSPLWGTLIGCVENNQPLFGFMDQPFTQERYWSDGETAWYARGDGEGATKGKRISTRTCDQLADAVLTTTHPDLFDAQFEFPAFQRLARSVRMTRYGGDCYGYALLASGGVNLVVETGLQPYDIMAMIPIIEGAGGVVTDWTGGSALDGGRILAAGDAAVHEAAMRCLASA